MPGDTQHVKTLKKILVRKGGEGSFEVEKYEDSILVGKANLDTLEIDSK